MDGDSRLGPGIMIRDWNGDRNQNLYLCKIILDLVLGFIDGCGVAWINEELALTQPNILLEYYSLNDYFCFDAKDEIHTIYTNLGYNLYQGMQIPANFQKCCGKVVHVVLFGMGFTKYQLFLDSISFRGPPPKKCHFFKVNSKGKILKINSSVSFFPGE